MGQYLKSRILEHISPELMGELTKICKDVTIRDNNEKVDLMLKALDKYNVDYNELGPGTNRFAVLIDGYVFKIAMDRLGVEDNWAEFSLTQELQPFVIKVYECNGIIIVTEYITVISKEEFSNNFDQVRQILSSIADRYLLGDVGTVQKNFMNWGYRDTGELVILDFGYVYRIQGQEMICRGLDKSGNECNEFLEYDNNFYHLRCPACGKKYMFTDIRVRIDQEFERTEVDMVKEIATIVTKPLTLIGESIINDGSNNDIIEEINETEEKEGNDMSKIKEFISSEETDMMYEDALKFLMNNSTNNEVDETPITNIGEIIIQTENEIIEIREVPDNEDIGIDTTGVSKVIICEDNFDNVTIDDDSVECIIDENFDYIDDSPEVESGDVDDIQDEEEATDEPRKIDVPVVDKEIIEYETPDRDDIDELPTGEPIDDGDSDTVICSCDDDGVKYNYEVEEELPTDNRVNENKLRNELLDHLDEIEEAEDVSFSSKINNVSSKYRRY